MEDLEEGEFSLEEGFQFVDEIHSVGCVWFSWRFGGRG